MAKGKYKTLEWIVTLLLCLTGLMVISSSVFGFNEFGIIEGTLWFILAMMYEFRLNNKMER